MAIGNWYAFVEPLESSGLMMITHALTMLVSAWNEGQHHESARVTYNRRLGELWDGLRWFIASHFKFNRRLDTPYWRARRSTDTRGADRLVAAFRELAPIRGRSTAIRRALATQHEVAFYGLSAYDCILLGQGVHTTLVESSEPLADWRYGRPA